MIRSIASLCAAVLLLLAVTACEGEEPKVCFYEDKWYSENARRGDVFCRCYGGGCRWQ